MAEISVGNIEGRILEDLTDALALARVGGEAVFRSVDTTTCEERLHQLQLAGPAPKAMVRYVHTDETDAVEGRRHCIVGVEILIGIKAASASNRAQVAEILRLVNAAKNAVEDSPPADAAAGGEPSRWRPRLTWGRPALDVKDHAPWIVGRVNLEVSYTLNSPTSH